MLVRFLLLALLLASASASARDPVVLTLTTPTADAPIVVRRVVGVRGDTTAVGEALAQSSVPRSLSGPSGRSSRSILTVSVVTFGGRIAYARRPVSGSAWSFPVAVEVSALLVGDGDGGLGLVSAVGGAVQAARRLGRSTVYLQPGVQLSGGQETGYSVYDDGQRFFLGGRLGLEIMRYPTRRGVVAGVGVYETRRFGSHIYNTRDVSLAVTLGAQF